MRISLLQYLRDNELEQAEQEICTNYADQLHKCTQSLSDGASFVELNEMYKKELSTKVDAVNQMVQGAIERRTSTTCQNSGIAPEQICEEDDQRKQELVVFQKYLEIVKTEKGYIKAVGTELLELEAILKHIKC